MENPFHRLNALHRNKFPNIACCVHPLTAWVYTLKWRGASGAVCKAHACRCDAHILWKSFCSVWLCNINTLVKASLCSVKVQVKAVCDCGSNLGLCLFWRWGGYTGAYFECRLILFGSSFAWLWKPFSADPAQRITSYSNGSWHEELNLSFKYLCDTSRIALFPYVFGLSWGPLRLNQT